MERRKRFASAVCTACGAGASLAQVNVPFSRPLLVLSLLLMVLGLALKGLAPGILTVGGGMLVYLGMFELPPQTSEMAGMGSNSGRGFVLVTFWLGVVFIIGAYALAYWPRRFRRW